MKWFRFILSHSIFISFCAVALCFQTYLLLHIPADRHVYSFVFFSTLCSYNFYWLISKYSFSRRDGLLSFFKTNISYAAVFAVAAVGMLYSLYFMAGMYMYILMAVLLTLLYSLPLWPFPFAVYARKAGFLKTTLLAFTWAYVTIVIPALPVLYTLTLPVTALFAARFLFMLMLCIIFDTRDINVDKMHTLRSLATDVSKRGLRVIMLVVFLLFVVAGFFVRAYFRDDSQQTAFVFTGLLVVTVYLFSQKKQGYFFYYFLVDGLMLLATAVAYLASLA
jgi:hypothetical protein